MEDTARQIADHIEQTRESLGSHLEELEQKVKSATDWRKQFQTRPVTLLSLAFGGGVVLAAVLGGPGRRSGKRQQVRSCAGPETLVKTGQRSDATLEAWDNVKGALIGVATTRLLDYVREAFPRFRKKTERTEDQAASPQRSSTSSSCP